MYRISNRSRGSGFVVLIVAMDVAGCGSSGNDGTGGADATFATSPGTRATWCAAGTVLCVARVSGDS